MTKKPLESYLLPQPKHRLAMGTALCVLALAFAWLAALSLQRLAGAERLQGQLAQLQSAQAQRAVPPPSRQQQDEEKQWAQVRLERDFPWEKVFHAIERTSSPDIELLEFHPDKLNRVIILRGEAKNFAALFAYLQNLTVKTGWAEVHLTHQEKVQHGTLETISFEIKANLGNSTAS